MSRHQPDAEPRTSPARPLLANPYDATGTGGTGPVWALRTLAGAAVVTGTALVLSGTATADDSFGFDDGASSVDDAGGFDGGGGFDGAPTPFTPDAGPVGDPGGSTSPPVTSPDPVVTDLNTAMPPTDQQPPAPTPALQPVSPDQTAFTPTTPGSLTAPEGSTPPSTPPGTEQPPPAPTPEPVPPTGTPDLSTTPTPPTTEIALHDPGATTPPDPSTSMSPPASDLSAVPANLTPDQPDPTPTYPALTTPDPVQPGGGTGAPVIDPNVAADAATADPAVTEQFGMTDQATTAAVDEFVNGSRDVTVPTFSTDLFPITPPVDETVPDLSVPSTETGSTTPDPAQPDPGAEVTRPPTVDTPPTTPTVPDTPVENPTPGSIAQNPTPSVTASPANPDLVETPTPDPLLTDPLLTDHPAADPLLTGMLPPSDSTTGPQPTTTPPTPTDLILTPPPTPGIDTTDAGITDPTGLVDAPAPHNPTEPVDPWWDLNTPPPGPTTTGASPTGPDLSIPPTPDGLLGPLDSFAEQPVTPTDPGPTGLGAGAAPAIGVPATGTPATITTPAGGPEATTSADPTPTDPNPAGLDPMTPLATTTPTGDPNNPMFPSVTTPPGQTPFTSATPFGPTDQNSDAPFTPTPQPEPGPTTPTGRATPTTGTPASNGPFALATTTDNGNPAQGINPPSYTGDPTAPHPGTLPGIAVQDGPISSPGLGWPTTWPQVGSRTDPTLTLTPMSELDVVQRNPVQGPLLNHVATNGQEDLYRLWDTTYPVNDEEDWYHAGVESAGIIRNLALNTSPLTPDQVHTTFSPRMLQTRASVIRSPREQEALQLGGLSGLNTPEIGCWLACVRAEDGSRTARVLPALEIGNDTQIAGVGGFLTRDMLKGVERVDFIHTHPLAPVNVTGPSLGDRYAAVAIDAHLQELGASVPLAISAIDMLTGTLVRAELNKATERWGPIQVFQTALEINDEINMEPFLLDTRTPIFDKPFPVDIAPRGFSASTIAKMKEAFQPSPEYLDARAADQADLEAFDRLLERRPAPSQRSDQEFMIQLLQANAEANRRRDAEASEAPRPDTDTDTDTGTSVRLQGASVRPPVVSGRSEAPSGVRGGGVVFAPDAPRPRPDLGPNAANARPLPETTPESILPTPERTYQPESLGGFGEGPQPKVSDNTASPRPDTRDLEWPVTRFPRDLQDAPDGGPTRDPQTAPTTAQRSAPTSRQPITAPIPSDIDGPGVSPALTTAVGTAPPGTRPATAPLPDGRPGEVVGVQRFAGTGGTDDVPGTATTVRDPRTGTLYLAVNPTTVPGDDGTSTRYLPDIPGARVVGRNLTGTTALVLELPPGATGGVPTGTPVTAVRVRTDPAPPLELRGDGSSNATPGRVYRNPDPGNAANEVWDIWPAETVTADGDRVLSAKVPQGYTGRLDLDQAGVVRVTAPAGTPAVLLTQTVRAPAPVPTVASAPVARPAPRPTPGARRIGNPTPAPRPAPDPTPVSRPASPPRQVVQQVAPRPGPMPQQITPQPVAPRPQPVVRPQPVQQPNLVQQGLAAVQQKAQEASQWVGTHVGAPLQAGFDQAMSTAAEISRNTIVGTAPYEGMPELTVVTFLDGSEAVFDRRGTQVAKLKGNPPATVSELQLRFGAGGQVLPGPAGAGGGVLAPLRILR